MSNLILSQMPEEIRNEIHLDQDGKAFISLRGLSRLTGVAITTLRESSVYGNCRTTEMKTQVGQSVQTIKACADIDAAVVIQYYASKGNEQAQKTLIAFSAVGIRAWCQSQLGYERPGKLETMMQDIMTEIKEMRQELKEWKQVDKQIEDQPGLKHIIDEYKKEKGLLESEGFTLKEWLEKRGISVNHSQMVKFGSRVAHTFKTHYEEEPHRLVRKGVKSCVYLERHNPMIEAAFRECFKG